MNVTPSGDPTSKIVMRPCKKQTRGKAVAKPEKRSPIAKKIALNGRARESVNVRILNVTKVQGPGSQMIVPARLMEHALDTFGSEKVAQTWLSSECGALNNQTPVAFLQSTGNSAEVERILGCIDYGMIA